MKNEQLVREYGLIGYPLGHAFSKTYFSEKFENEGISNVKYHLFPLSDISKIRNILEAHPNLQGLNVTTPYKELVIPYLNDLDPVALSIGAVNTITIDHFDDGGMFLKGYNTDVLGVEKLFEGFDLPAKALVLGSGGSSHAVRHALKMNGISGVSVTRHPRFDDHVTYEELNKQIINEHRLIINCTPVGMYPKVNNCPELPYEFIGPNHICLDLIYNPEKSLFLEKAEAQGAKIRSGMPMLVEQAERAWDIWQNAYHNESKLLELNYDSAN